MEATERLATLVVARRVQLGYRRRPALAEAAGISLRTLGDIETGRRDRYDPATIAAVEHALRWATGSINRILEGGEPTELSTSTPAATKPATSERDEALIRVMTSDLPDAKKAQIVQLLIAEKQAAERARLQRADDLINLLREPG